MYKVPLNFCKKIQKTASYVCRQIPYLTEALGIATSVFWDAEWIDALSIAGFTSQYIILRHAWNNKEYITSNPIFKASNEQDQQAILKGQKNGLKWLYAAIIVGTGVAITGDCLANINVDYGGAVQGFGMFVYYIGEVKYTNCYHSSLEAISKLAIEKLYAHNIIQPDENTALLTI